MYTNFELSEIVTPINIEVLEQLLIKTGYAHENTKRIVDSFRQGFDIGYRGPTERRDISRNLPFTVGNEVVLWNKIMKEIKAKRYSGPFDSIPQEFYMQSPVGLVPKDNNKTRLIFHLLFDFGTENERKLLNFHTPAEFCSVHYPDLDHTINNCLLQMEKLPSLSDGIFLSKTDLTAAFRILPVKVCQR